MANFRFFADLADGTVVQSNNKADYDRGERKLPRIFDTASGQWVRCTRVVIRKTDPSMHECDARCMFATGRTMQCECSCGGHNHGKGNIMCEAAA
jgi:hypothetical protein